MWRWLVLAIIVLVCGVFAQTVDTLLVMENFDTWLPAGWDTLNLDGAGGSNAWFQDSADGVGSEKFAEIDFSPTYYSQDWLITPAIDASASADSIILNFWQDFSHFGGEQGSSYVLMSPDGGTTWPDTIVTYTNWVASGNETGAVSVRLDGGTLSANTKIAFYYHHYNSNYWYVDSVEVLLFASEPYPPTFSHIPYYRSAMPHTYVSLPETVDINDMTGISSAQICYDVDSSGTYSCIAMSYIGVDPNLIGEWVGNIPTPPGWSKVQYYFRATDSYSPASIGYSDTFEVVVQGDYYAFDDVDIDAEAPDPTWIDVSALPGAYLIDGPWTATTDDSLITLPFTFRYWGIDYNSVTVHMACLLRFGSLGSSFDPSTNQDFPDPDPTGPNGVIAGMWDEFMATGSVGGDVWVYDTGDTFAVMFENMGWLPPGGGSHWNALTMEILLLNPSICSEPGGNGEIIVKYQIIDTDSILDYSTVGVENETGELGMTYLFDGTYDPTSAGVVPGRAIKFTSTPPLYAGTGGVVIGWADFTDTPTIGDPGINIELQTIGLNTITGADGKYIYTGVPPGTYITKGTATDYNYDASSLFEVFEGETTYVDTLYLSPMNYYIEDFEDGSEPGSVIGGGWEWGTYSISSYTGSGTPPTSAHSGTDMWGTNLESDYTNSAWWWLVLPTGPRMISFWHYYDAEDGWDGGVVAYSVDGSTYTTISPVDGYDDAVLALSDSGFTGNSGGWVQDSIDLSATSAEYLAFMFGSDGSFSDYAGWYVDDVLVPNRLDKYGEVDGYVYDSETFTVIPGATVFAVGDTTTTDSYGYYHLTHVVVGTQRVWATAPGYVPNGMDILVGRGSVTRQVIPLTPVDITPEDGATWDMSYGENNNFAVTICNPTTDTIFINASLIDGGAGLMRTLSPYDAPSNHDYEHTPHAMPVNAENNAIVAEKMSHFEAPRDKPAPNRPLTRMFTFSSGDYGDVPDAPYSTKALTIVDSLDVATTPTVSEPWAVGCRGLSVPYDYWVTSMDLGTWETFNVQFGLDKEPTGGFFSTYPFTGFFYTPGDLAYDGRWFWQSIPGLAKLYAWDPNTGDLVDSLWDPTGAEWDTAGIWGVGYDPVEDVFYLGDDSGILWQVAGKSWTNPGQMQNAWWISPSDVIYGVAFDPVRRTVWITSYWNENLTEWDPNYIDGWLFLDNTIDVPATNLYGMEVGADRKLWVAIEYYLDLRYPVYGFGLPDGYHPAGIGVEPAYTMLPPGECVDIVFATSNNIPPGQYDMTLGIQIGNQDGIWTDYLNYPVTINISRSLAQGWNIISVPVAANPDNVYVQLSDNIVPFSNEPPNSNIYAWDSEHGLYTTPDVFERGRGYYLFSLYDDTHIDVSGVPYYDAFTMTLPYYSGATLPGWNLVGNPVNTEIDWDAITSDPVFYGIYPIYYTLTPGGWATYSPGFPAGVGRYIDPFEGFYVLVQPSMTGVLPIGLNSIVHTVAFDRAASPSSLPDFALRLSVATPENNDDWNYIATRYGASDDFDGTFDASVPPAIPGVDEIAVLDCAGYELSRDVKSEMSDGDLKTWTLQISGAENGQDIVISWPIDHTPDQTDISLGMNQIYSGYEFDLYDPITGEHTDMRSTGFYSFTYNGARNLIITVSANVLGADNHGKVPAKFSLGANVPNPFNSATDITFSLPVESNIDIEVMDVSGRTVKTLVSGEIASGTHTVRWNGTDNNGSEVSSGIYFYRLRTNSYNEIRRMILLK